jgi:hypothetical protein
MLGQQKSLNPVGSKGTHAALLILQWCGILCHLITHTYSINTPSGVLLMCRAVHLMHAREGAIIDGDTTPTFPCRPLAPLAPHLQMAARIAAAKEARAAAEAAVQREAAARVAAARNREQTALR